MATAASGSKRLDKGSRRGLAVLFSYAGTLLRRRLARQQALSSGTPSALVGRRVAAVGCPELAQISAQ